jgi:DNA processing protein
MSADSRTARARARASDARTSRAPAPAAPTTDAHTTGGRAPRPLAAATPDARAPRALTAGDAGFPLIDPDLLPPLRRLWVCGRPIEDLGACVAIVGSRRATPYGLEIARSLAADLATAGVCVVSGMARGIDAAAHEGALSAGGATIAVLASGADVPSPRSNAGLYARVIEAGAVVSERPPGAAASKHEYPVRNRIIVAMSRAVVVVQGETRSGSSHSASWASRLNRQLFAVPGDVRSPLSALPHALLREGVAAPCTCAGDVLGDLDLLPTRTTPIPEHLGEDEAAILRALTDIGPSGAEALGARAGLTGTATARALAGLELDGYAARDVGATYRRTR